MRPRRPRVEQLAGWGRAPVVEAHEIRSEDLARITDGTPLSCGVGRSYGDSSLPASPDHDVVSTVLANRMPSFDEATGVLRVDAGLSLRDIYILFLPLRGAQSMRLLDSVAGERQQGAHVPAVRAAR